MKRLFIESTAQYTDEELIGAGEEAILQLRYSAIIKMAKRTCAL